MVADMDRERALEVIRECGWSHSPAEGWAFEGEMMDQPALGTPDLCHETLNAIGEKLEDQTVLLVTRSAGDSLILSCHSPTKALAITTGVESAEDIGALSTMLLGDGYKLEMVEGTGFMLFIRP